MYEKKSFYFYGILLCLILLGCGTNQQLKGRVTFSDGEPLGTGTIIFSKPGFISRSFILPDGSFKVGSVKAGDGIPAGKYKVHIIEAMEPVEPDNPSNDAMRTVVEARYTSEKTTPLEIEIPSKNLFNIVVERPVKAKKQ